MEAPFVARRALYQGPSDHLIAVFEALMAMNVAHRYAMWDEWHRSGEPMPRSDFASAYFGGI